MAEQDFLFPNRIVLNGIDYFLLQMDRIMFRSSGQRNVCTFVVTLQEPLEHAFLKHYLSVHPAYQWISRLRLRQRIPFALVQWVVDAEAALPEINQYQLTEDGPVPQSLLATPLEVENQTPFKVDLLQQASGAGSLLVFTWHHALMDARGGESFIYYLGLGQPSEQPVWKTPEQPDVPFREQAKIAQEMKQFLYAISQRPLISLYKAGSGEATLRYRLVSFSQQQSRLIGERARHNGAGFLVSAFYLAATACAVAHIQRQRAPLAGDLFVPVPQDRRRRGARGPLIGNQVTFLFYRIPRAALCDVQTCMLELIEQMKSLMRSYNPGRYLIMMHLSRRLPGPLYRALLKSPTAGSMGSFFYSDTGDSLQNYGELFDRRVDSAVHYPPNAHPPGVTFVFSRFRGALQLTIGYMEQVIDEEEVEQLIFHLRSTLLGEAIDQRHKVDRIP